MPFSPLKTNLAIKIVKEIGTVGSSPLLVIDRNGNEYFAKTTTLDIPRTEIINEVFCSFALATWEINVPPICLLKIPYELVLQYNIENETPISNRYKQEYFDNTLFFGSEKINKSIELQDFLPGISKTQFKKLHSPKDLIKIGVFDLWIGNKDRKPENPNFLMSLISEKIAFYAIDHTAAFAYHTNYQDVKDLMLRIERKDCILSTALAKNILQFLPKRINNELKSELLKNITNFNKEYDNIVSLIPIEWGFSKKAKAHLKNFFNDSERNIRIVNAFLN